MSDYTNASPVDIITVPSVGTVGDVKFSISAELMHNSKAGSPIDPTENIVTVQDSEGHPMIFAINNQGIFSVIRHDNGSADGWSAVKLSTQFEGYEKARAFDVSQDVAGKLTITLALSKPGSKSTDIFVASGLSNDYAKMDWSLFKQHSAQISGFAVGFEADRILMGTQAGEMHALTVLTGNINEQKCYYLINDGKTSNPLEFPENASDNSDAVSAMAIGYTLGQRGVAFLYKVGEAQTLEVTTLDGDGGERNKSYDYSPQNATIPKSLRDKYMTYSCIATATGRETDPFYISTDLYVGSDTGIYVFPSGEVSAMQEVTSALKDVHELIVRTDDAGNISIWALVSPNDVYYIYGKRGDTYQWNAPVKFSGNAIHIAPTRSNRTKTNELLIVNQDANLTHYWQDPNSTLWRNRTLTLKGGGSILNFESFTTHINISSPDGSSLPKQLVRITSSEWIYATINGLIYSLDKDNPAEVATDGMGNITIITDTNDISSPIFHIDGDGFDKILNIYPNGKITKGLQAIQSGDDLKNAKTKDGENVVNDALIRSNQEVLNGVADSIKKLSTAASGDMVGLGSNTYTIVANKGVKADGRLQTSNQQPAGFVVGMRVQNGQWAAMPANAVMSTGSLGDFTHWFGDAIHEIGEFFKDTITEIKEGITYLKDGVSFIIYEIDKGFRFVLTIGENIYNVLLDTLSAIGKVFSWVFKLLKVELEQFLAWLGHLLGWDDIWATHKVLAKLMTNTLDYSADQVTKELDQWKKSVSSMFDTLEGEIKQLVLPDDIKSRCPAAYAKQENTSNPYQGLLHSPVGNHSFYHLQHGWSRGSVREVTAGNPFTQFLNDVVIPTTTAIYEDIKKDLANLQHLLQTGSVEDVYKLINSLIDTVFDPIRKLALGFMDFLEDIVKDVQSLLEDDFHIPLLGDLYEWLTGLLGEKEPLTGINAVALIIAIPATYIFKALNGGKAPFEDAAAKELMEKQNMIQILMYGDLTVREGTSIADDAARTLGAIYSGFGGVIGSLAAIGLSIVNAIKWADTTGEISKSVLNGFTAGLTLIKFAGTFPVPLSSQHMASTVLKIIAWAGALINSFVGMLTPEKVAATVLIVADLFILILAMVADGLAAGTTYWLTWFNDILSNLSGMAVGVGKLTKETEVGAIVLTIGIGFTFVAATTGMIGALMKAVSGDNDIFHLINVGGL